MTREEEDIAFIKDPTRWPNKLVLPVKNYKERIEGGWPKMGIIMVFNTQTVFLKNMFELDHNTDFSTLPKQEYDSVEAMVAAGWIVD